MNTFLVTTMGGWTINFDAGTRMDGSTSSGSQISWKHTLTEMNYMFDSGPSNSNSFGLMGGIAGEEYIIGNMYMNPNNTSESPDHETPLWQQPHDPYSTSSGGQRPTVITNVNYRPYPCIPMITFAAGVNYWFFGDQPGSTGGDYFKMVLETYPGVFAHFWIGVAESGLTEMTTPYGSYMGASAHFQYSNYSRWDDPFTSLFTSQWGRAEFIHFPEGNSNGQIDVSAKRRINNTHVPATDWAVAMNGVNGTDSAGPWVAGDDNISGRTMISTPSINIKHECGDYQNWSSIVTRDAEARAVWMGPIRDVGLVTLQEYLPKDTFTLDGQTWIVFPKVRRSNAPGIYSHPGMGNSTAGNGRWAEEAVIGITNSGFGGPGGPFNNVREGYVTTGLEGYAYRTS